LSDLAIRTEGFAGCITLSRPKQLNALTHEMCLKIEAALDSWRHEDAVGLVVVDAVGKSFCAGGDIQEMYRKGIAGNFEYGRRYWRDEYRLNAKLARYPKPIVTFLRGYVMGGGVGIGCHASHRIVGESSRIAMPECTIGLVPDVGGSHLLSRSPGHTGEFLAMTGERLEAEDAIYAGFADRFVPEADWPDARRELVASGVTTSVDRNSTDRGKGALARNRADIDRHFKGRTPAAIVASLHDCGDSFARECLKRMSGNSPLSMACACELVRRQRAVDSIEEALDLEFRFVYRSAEWGEFLEGIRARLIERGSRPNWRHSCVADVAEDEIAWFLRPLNELALKWDGAA